MASFLDPTYTRARDSASSGGEISDVNPERGYDVDVRRLDDAERRTADAADTRNERQQGRARKFFQAAKSAGRYRQKASVDEPLVRGTVTRNPANFAGTLTPSLGDTQGPVGSTNYANKPQPFSGKSYQWIDGFS
jgi:hypothetical protein